jgi:hypothetical protein
MNNITRRTILLGMVSSVAGGSAFLGYGIGKRESAGNTDDHSFLENNSNVNFQHLSTDLLIKLFDSNLTLADRPQLEKQLVWFNHVLYAPTGVGRRFGVPGCYSIKKGV